ncbi:MULTISPECIES: response regulator transcription factor [Prolixibacter]|uniref:DNA-binding response OmpR family regulator n=1 Tax=Prolixibacter denitrificans TaxID=1541063 RepID=A0A2P8CBM0_9BACT|nr:MULTISPECIES: response regulator transcription factor [Prolixibacter]PSK82345.1 DNA-binding response OmpR family regulator [Prolixibacter denitrificans]GET22910.1 DNA-binding response regulator [Prolixibacter denitrificans]GET25746.1 DNA-binding response regulator [Prolixibacter sp. NT017]
MRILVIEDEPGIARFLKEGLEEESFAVDVAEDGIKGQEMAMDNGEEYDLLLVDWMLPGMSGVEIVRQIREEGLEMPVIFLTARDTVQDAVFALEMGANDYIRKPFSFEELLARIRVQLREPSGETSHLGVGKLQMDLNTHQVFRGEEEIQLTQKEFALLEFLLRNKGKACSRTRIIEHVWDIHFDYDTSVIDVYINSLRKKIDKKDEPGFIRTIRGVGYIIQED